MNTINILGINISVTNKKEVLDKIEHFLAGDKPNQITTLNPEFLLAAGHDEEFFFILGEADLAIPDGIGLKMMAWMMGKNINRITGADLVKDIINIAQQRKLKVAIINRKDGISNSEEIKKSVLQKYPRLRIVVEDIEQGDNIISKFIINQKPDILFCSLGAPWQEKYIYHNLKLLPSVKIGMGVGGSFDFLTGKIKRAPKIMRTIGMEWLWRLIKQPGRIKRILNAVIIFPLKFIKWKFILPFLYRPNVVCLLYKKITSLDNSSSENLKYQILLAKRRDAEDYWQFPQGGTDGQNLTTAGMRELSEEIGCGNNCASIKPIAIYNNLYKYKFNNQPKEFKEKYIRVKKHLGYKGQKQGLFIAEYLGSDEQIKINFWDHTDWKWVEAEKVLETIHPVRQTAAKIFMEKFWNIMEAK